MGFETHVTAVKAGWLNVTLTNYRNTDALDGVLGAVGNTLLCPRCVPGSSACRRFPAIGSAIIEGPNIGIGTRHLLEPTKKRELSFQQKTHNPAHCGLHTTPSSVCHPSHPRGIFVGSNLSSTLPITKGWCSPALPTNVYDRSNPFGPRIFISQPSFSREPTIDTRQSPGLSLRACSTSARTSAPAPGSPVLCSSSDTAISVYSTVGEPSGSILRQPSF
jgi:hypothetical protein